MKKPRLTDFDPNSSTPKLASPLDDMPTIQPNTPDSSSIEATSFIKPSKSKVKKSSSEEVSENKKVTQQSNNNDSGYASTLARYQDSIIETIRKTVKTTGREVSFVRLTPDEKMQLTDIVYTYKKQGVKTSENEINRIAVNFLLEDYTSNGKNSVLARVIEALLA